MVFAILKVHLALAHLKGIVTKSMFYHACSIFYQTPVERPLSTCFALFTSFPFLIADQFNVIQKTF